MFRESRAFLTAAVGLATALVAGCTSTATTTANSAAVAETVFDSNSDFIVEATARGRPLRLRVDPGAPWFIVLNGSVARSLRLVGTSSATFVVGPLRLKGKTRSEKFTFGSEVASRSVMWFQGDSVQGADGVINPAQLPWKRVLMRLRTPRASEQIIELPMRFDKERGLYHEFLFGGEIILTRFTLADPLTTATGATASLFARRRQGLWKGSPFSHPVRFGTVRLVRRMVLGEPVSLKGFTFSEVTVRIRDDLGDYRLPQGQVATDEVDNDIVITGKDRQRFGAAHFWLMVGSDDLTRCSSISYDLRSRRMILSCSLSGA